MSYELYLHDDNGVCVVDDHSTMSPRTQTGGLIKIATKITDPETGEERIELGNREANLNITTNYSKHFPFRKLHCVEAGTVIPWLEHIVSMYGTKQHVSDPPDPNDYWQPTKGNVGYCLSIILSWCKQHPKATITVYQ